MMRTAERERKRESLLEVVKSCGESVCVGGGVY